MPLAEPPVHSGRRASRVVWWVDALWSAGAGVVAVVAAWFALGLTPTTLGERWQTSVDGVLHAALFALAARGSSYTDVHAMGFPNGLNVFFSGQVDPSSAVVMAVLGLVLPTGSLMLGVFTLLGFFSSAVTAYWFGRALRLSRPTAAGIGIVFALAPYHFEQITFGHYFIANTWAIPLIGILVLMVQGGALDPFAAWRRSVTGRSRVLRSVLPAVLLVLAVATTGSYFAFFAVIVVGGAWIIRVATALVGGVPRSVGRHGHEFTGVVRTLVRPTLATAGLAVAVGLSIVVMGLGFGVRSHPYFSTRLPYESEQFAGKLTTLLLPWTGSDLPGVGRVDAKFARANLLLPASEPPGAPILAILGIVVVVLVLCISAVAVGRRRTVHGPFRALLDPRIVRLGPIVLWTFLFFTVSGLGFAFAIFIGPEVRSWSRLSIVLVLFGLGALGVLVDHLPRRTWLRIVVGVVIAVVVLLDQLTGVTRVAGIDPTDDAATRAFVQRADAALPAGCGVVQLPLKTFPDSGPIGNMADYDEALPFIADPTADLQWSYGAIPGTVGWDTVWAHAQQAGTPAALATAVHATGACAVEVDTDAYVQGDAGGWRRLVAAVADPDRPITTTPDGKLRIFRVRG